MKLFAIVSVFVLLCSSLVVADEQAEVEVEAGTTPDSPMWGIDVAMDNLALALTFNEDKKAERALRIADERLSEMAQLAREKKLEKLEKAREQHQKMLLRVQERLEHEDEATEESLETELKLEAKLEAQKQRLAKVEVEVKGSLTAEQQAALGAFLATLGEDVKNVQIKIQSRQEETKAELRQRDAKAEEKIAKLEAPSWERKAKHEQEKAAEEIRKAEAKIERFLKEQQMVAAKATARAEIKDDDDEDDETEDESEAEDAAEDLKEESEEKNETNEDSQAAEQQNAGLIDITADVVAEPTLEEKLEVEDNILAEFDLSLPDPEVRSVETARRFVALAKEELAKSKTLFASEEFRSAYAHAKFARRLANAALKGKYLRAASVTTAQARGANAQLSEDEKKRDEARRLEEQKKADDKRLREEKEKADRLEKERLKKLEEGKREEKADEEVEGSGNSGTS